jgi:peptidoglycan/LPS O-acetylase OafA/YrhL
MGTIRLLLALAVVFGHAPGWGHLSEHSIDPIRPIAPYYAVQAFFVISGFYMEMIQSRYRPAGLWVFWSNRYSRLIASYLVVVFATVLLSLALPERAPPFEAFVPENKLEYVLLELSNLSIFGTDLVAFLGVRPLAGLIVPQSWSLGIELWFYLLVPLFWRTKARYLWAIVLCGLALRITISATELPAFPWQQRFFPSELAFFLIGMLSYRHRRTMSGVVSPPIAYVSVLTGLLFSGWVAIPTSTLFSTSMAALLFCTLPSIWETSFSNHFDRSIGELSYPVYLVHITIGYFVLQSQFMWNGGLLMLISVTTGGLLYFLVDRPLDAWRERRRQHAIYKTIAAIA